MGTRTTTTRIVTPQYSINGTSPQSLAEQFANAEQKIQEAIDAVVAAAPHGRDYQHDYDQYPQARKEYVDRLNALEDIRRHYGALRDDAMEHVK